MKLPSTIGITGVAGFVGANLSERLLAEGCAVVGVDDMSAGSMYNLAPFLDHPGFQMQEFDCRDVKRLRREFAECDAIVHLAAMKIPRYGGALRTLEVNVDGTHAVFDVAMSTGADHAHLLPTTGEEHPASEQGGCPDCTGHSAMALTCLAALILLAAGLLLPRPSAGRGILQPRLTSLTVPQLRHHFKPPPLSLVELSVSRT